MRAPTQMSEPSRRRSTEERKRAEDRESTEAAKRIARELYELQQEDERSQYRSLEDERWHS
jgi:hypothetical protein